MAMRGGMYSANKRKKELQRKKKQEEKRLRRQKGSKNTPPAGQEPDITPDSQGAGGDVLEETDN